MYFDLEKAERVKNFIEELTLTAGVWAGEKFKLLDWQWEKLIKPFFGTLKAKDGPRQYRFCYVEIPKKNGKTELAAALALYFLCADRENRPAVYSAAADRDQASLVFGPAAIMAENHPILVKNLQVLRAGKRISNFRNNGFYHVLSSEVKTKHGLNPSAVIVDELHAQPNDQLWNVLTSGTHYARHQQAVIVLTTAGIYDKESIWWKVRHKAMQIQKGIIKQPNFLPVLYIADPEKDNPEDRELWKRVNPSLNQIFNIDKIEEDFKDAKEDPVEFENFKRFRLNIPIRQLSKWMPMDKWDLCGGIVDEKALEGRTCYGGLDASTKIDLTSFVLIFPSEEEDDKIIVLPKFYVPADTIMQRSRIDNIHYEIWEQENFLTATPGNVISHAHIREDIEKAAEKFNLQSIGYDPRDMSQLAQELQDEVGINMEEIKQTYGEFSEPAKDLLVKVMQGKINHGDHPVLRWCADNLVMKVGLREEVLPAKDKATDRIDGMVALIMANRQMMFGEREYLDMGEVTVL